MRRLSLVKDRYPERINNSGISESPAHIPSKGGKSYHHKKWGEIGMKENTGVPAEHAGRCLASSVNGQLQTEPRGDTSVHLLNGSK